jgi:hypothetical protein
VEASVSERLLEEALANQCYPVHVSQIFDPTTTWRARIRPRCLDRPPAMARMYTTILWKTSGLHAGLCRLECAFPQSTRFSMPAAALRLQPEGRWEKKYQQTPGKTRSLSSFRWTSLEFVNLR